MVSLPMLRPKTPGDLQETQPGGANSLLMNQTSKIEDRSDGGHRQVDEINKSHKRFDDISFDTGAW
jgi:hypothetical protein